MPEGLETEPLLCFPIIEQAFAQIK
jgi:hypothetical protein